MSTKTKKEAVLSVKGLQVHYETTKGWVKAVEDVTFDLERGKRLALVGESGSGKTTMAMGLMRMIKEPGKIVSGSIEINGKDIISLSDSALRATRLKEIALVPQGAMNSLNPVMRVQAQMSDAIKHHTKEKISKKDLSARITVLLNSVGLNERVAQMFPHELSGGMKQRVAMAIATSMKPQVILADEPTSALDVVVQRQVVSTLGRLQKEIGASVVIIGHDMGLVSQFADMVGVMYAGKLIELGPVIDIFKKPLHLYTKLLISSLPNLDSKREFKGIPGLPPLLIDLPDGCTFCQRIEGAKRNDGKNPEWTEVKKDHWVALCNDCVDLD
jgi:peptide/nickel transport system ATP-binding protein